jgi:hypothetical protein
MPEVCPPGAPSRTPCRQTSRCVPTLAASLCRHVAPMSSTLQSGSATVRHMADTTSQTPALVAGMPRIKLEMREGSSPRGCVRETETEVPAAQPTRVSPGGRGLKNILVSLAMPSCSLPHAKCSAQRDPVRVSRGRPLELSRPPAGPGPWAHRLHPKPSRRLLRPLLVSPIVVFLFPLIFLVAGCLFHPCAHWPSRWPGRPFAGLVPACRTV